MKPTLTIVSGGMGEPGLLTGKAKEALDNAGRIYTTQRLAEGLLEHYPNVLALPIPDIVGALREKASPAVVVVSGDAGFYSLSRLLEEELGESYELQTISGISSLQYLCAKRGVPWNDAKVLSLHGRSGSPLGAASYHEKTFILCGGAQNANAVLKQLAAWGAGHLRVTAGENLSSPMERILSGPPSSLAKERFSGPVVLLVENPYAANPHTRLRDEDFARGEVPMTKETVRTVSVSRLGVQPGDIVWDIGAGTGAVSAALAYAARDGLVYAVERNPHAAGLIRENRKRLGAYNIIVVEAKASEGLVELPAPQKVFVGGSGGNLKEILQLVAKLPEPVAVCVNAVTLESLSEATSCLNAMGYGGVEAVCVNAANAKKLGGYHLMQAENPVYIITGGRGDWAGG